MKMLVKLIPEMQMLPDLSLNGISGSYHAFTRSEEGEYLVEPGESKKYDVIVDYFVDEITGPYNQDVSLLLVGNKGKGKSYAALSMAYWAACEVAERKGGTWKDYFDPERHMAVISPVRANQVMAIKDKYCIKNYDDIGIGWGARSWQKKENIEKGDVFQINRIDNQIQIFSVPNQFLLDKIPRSLVSHYAEMDQPFFTWGFTTIKLFKPLTLFREGKIIQPYLSTNRAKFILYRVPKPPDFLIKLYTKIRKEATTEAMQERLTNKEGTKKSTKPKPLEIIEDNRKEVRKIIKEGGDYRKRVIEYFVQEIGVSEPNVRYWFHSGKFKQLHLTPKDIKGDED